MARELYWQDSAADEIYIYYDNRKRDSDECISGSSFDTSQHKKEDMARSSTD